MTQERKFELAGRRSRVRMSLGACVRSGLGDQAGASDLVVWAIMHERHARTEGLLPSRPHAMRCSRAHELCGYRAVMFLLSSLHAWPRCEGGDDDGLRGRDRYAHIILAIKQLFRASPLQFCTICAQQTFVNSTMRAIL